MSVLASSGTDFDAERLNIARELHDAIAYGFAAINLHAGAAVYAADETPQQAVEALQAIRVASRDALEDLRGILGVLRHSEESAGAEIGVDRLKALVETTSKAGVPTRLDVSGQLDALPSNVGRAAYRIVQEALANVLRHAGDATADVSVHWIGERLFITVENDGVGRPHGGEHATENSGYGIMGMRERAVALRGDLEAGPRPEGGFRVSAILPIPVHS